MDKYNNPTKNLISMGIRDQSDQIHVDLQNRDVNGNVKTPIGEDIHEHETKEFYEKDEEYKKKLDKLAKLRKMNLGLFKTDDKEVYLPQITAPVERDDLNST